MGSDNQLSLRREPRGLERLGGAWLLILHLYLRYCSNCFKPHVYITYNKQRYFLGGKKSLLRLSLAAPPCKPSGKQRSHSFNHPRLTLLRLLLYGPFFFGSFVARLCRSTFPSADRHLPEGRGRAWLHLLTAPGPNVILQK